MTPTQAQARWASFTEEERLAMAKTAPRVASAWWQNPHTLQWWRSCANCDDEALCFADGGGRAVWLRLTMHPRKLF